MHIADFWWYNISRREAGQLDFAKVVLEYERDYIKTGKQFHAAHVDKR